jgi:hypothetical protein
MSVTISGGGGGGGGSGMELNGVYAGSLELSGQGNTVIIGSTSPLDQQAAVAVLSEGNGTTISHTGITFSDSTYQQTAFSGRNYAAEAANALASATQYLSVISGWDETNGNYYLARWVGAEDGVMTGIVTNTYAFAPAPFFNSYTFAHNYSYAIAQRVDAYTISYNQIYYFDQYGWIAANAVNSIGGQVYIYASINAFTTGELSFAPIHDFV